MINVETIKFVKMLDELAELSKKGIEPFESATEETYGTRVFYDEKSLAREKGYKIVLDACIWDNPECYHHDIISYYDSDSLEYKVRVMIDEDGAFIVVTLVMSDSIVIIENGGWHIE